MKKEQELLDLAKKYSWYYISIYQELSEPFMEKYWNNLNKNCISKYQKLSEPFMEKYWNDLDKNCISKYQKLSNDFRKKYNIKNPKDSWLYETIEEKLKYIKEETNYEVIDDKYIIAYKSVRDDYLSFFNFQYKYEIGKIYESHCDCNLGEEDSFGLSAWTKKGALDYYNEGRLLKVKIAIEDIGAIVRNNNKIRCFKLEVLYEVV